MLSSILSIITSSSVAFAPALASPALFSVGSSLTYPTVPSQSTLVSTRQLQLRVLLESPRISHWTAVILNLYLIHRHRSFHVCRRQLFIALNPSDPSSDITKLTICLDALQSWFSLNGMALNPDKSDATLLGTHQHSSCHTSLRSIDVAGCSVPLYQHKKVLRVTLDSYLSWIPSYLGPFAWLLPIILLRLLPLPSWAPSWTMPSVCFWHHTEKHYPASMCPKYARVVAGQVLPRGTHSSAILQHLHWLLVNQRIKFKLATMTHNTHDSSQPAYLHSLLSYHIPARSLRSSNTNLLSVPRVHTTFALLPLSKELTRFWHRCLFFITYILWSS